MQQRNSVFFIAICYTYIAFHIHLHPGLFQGVNSSLRSGAGPCFRWLTVTLAKTTKKLNHTWGLLTDVLQDRPALCLLAKLCPQKLKAHRKQYAMEGCREGGRVRAGKEGARGRGWLLWNMSGFFCFCFFFNLFLTYKRSKCLEKNTYTHTYRTHHNLKTESRFFYAYQHNIFLIDLFIYGCMHGT